MKNRHIHELPPAGIIVAQQQLSPGDVSWIACQFAAVPVNPRGYFRGSSDGVFCARTDTVACMTDYVPWWEAEWYKEWERLATHTG